MTGQALRRLSRVAYAILNHPGVQFLVFAVSAAPMTAALAAVPCVLTAAAEAVAVEHAIDGDTVLLDDGREVRLAGVAAPKAPLEAPPGAWPAQDVSRKALEALVAGKVLELRPATRPQDRYGRTVGFLSEIDAADHAGVSAWLAAGGAARWSGEGRDCGATLREAEAGAIAGRLGLWSEPYYEVRNAGDATAVSTAAGRFVVAEGRVAGVQIGRAHV